MADEKTTKGASSLGDASPDAWMQGRISAERGERRTPPLWFLPSDQAEWLAGFDSLPAGGDQP